jgi:3-hydroxybutyryl-CoA dehydrogenase
MLYSHLPQVIGIVGAGQMGSGIAQVCAAKGLEVIITDRAHDLLERSVVSIRKQLNRLVQKGQLPADAAKESMERIRTESKLDVSCA